MMTSTARLRLSLFAVICFLLCVGLLPAQATDKLNASFTNVDGRVSFNYPKDWNVRVTANDTPWVTLAATLTNTVENPDPEGLTLPRNQIDLSFRAGYEQYINMMYRADTELIENPTDLANYLIDNGERNTQRYVEGDEDPPFTYSEVSSLTLGGVPAAAYTYFTPANVTFAIIVWYPDGFINMFTLNAANESILNKWKPVALAIADSFTFKFDEILSPEEWQQDPPVADTYVLYSTEMLPELPLHYGASDQFTFNYPDAWFAERHDEDYGYNVLLVSDVSRLNDPSQLLRSGQAEIRLLFLNGDLLPSTVSLTNSVDALRLYYLTTNLKFLTYFGYNEIQPIGLGQQLAGLSVTDPHPNGSHWADGMIVSLDTGNGWFAYIILSAAYGELDAWMDTVLAVAASIQVGSNL